MTINDLKIPNEYKSQIKGLVIDYLKDSRKNRIVLTESGFMHILGIIEEDLN